jgi:hypothetical protein
MTRPMSRARHLKEYVRFVEQMAERLLRWRTPNVDDTGPDGRHPAPCCYQRKWFKYPWVDLSGS